MALHMRTIIKIVKKTSLRWPKRAIPPELIYTLLTSQRLQTREGAKHLHFKDIAPFS